MEKYELYATAISRTGMTMASVTTNICKLVFLNPSFIYHRFIIIIFFIYLYIFYSKGGYSFIYHYRFIIIIFFIYIYILFERRICYSPYKRVVNKFLVSRRRRFNQSMLSDIEYSRIELVTMVRYV